MQRSAEGVTDSAKVIDAVIAELMIYFTETTIPPIQVSKEMLQKINVDLAEAEIITLFLTMVKSLPPLTQATVEKLFYHPLALLELYFQLNDIDETNAAFNYFFERLTANTKTDELVDQLAKNGAEKWLTVELFKNITDHPNEFFGVISSFQTMHALGMLDSHRLTFLNNIESYYNFFTLRFCNMLTKENAILALANPDFSEARYLCDNTTYKICHFQGIFKTSAEIHVFNDVLLRNPELATALVTFHKICTQRAAMQRPIAAEECQVSVKYLLGIKSDNPQSFREHSIFISPRMPILEKRLAELKKKYEYVEPSPSLRRP